MPDWKDTFFKQFVLLLENERDLEQPVREAIKQIQMAPTSTGQWMGPSRYTYSDPQGCFSIAYHYVPEMKCPILTELYF